MEKQLKVNSPSERKQRRDYIVDNIISTAEAMEYLDLSKSRLFQLHQKGFLSPLATGIYLEDDIIQYKKAFDEARAESKWLRDFK